MVRNEISLEKLKFHKENVHLFQFLYGFSGCNFLIPRNLMCKEGNKVKVIVLYLSGLNMMVAILNKEQ